MSKLLQSIGSTSLRYSRSLDRSVSRMMRRQSYGRLGPAESYESSSPSFTFRVPRKLRVVKLRSRRASSSPSQGNNKQGKLGNSKIAAEQESSSTFFRRLRDRYERLMFRAASKSGESTAIPVAKASRAPPALESAFDPWSMGSAFRSRRGTKVSDLDLGFKMTFAEKAYVGHLKRMASSGRV